jgi:hypothetical protein
MGSLRNKLRAIRCRARQSITRGGRPAELVAKCFVYSFAGLAISFGVVLGAVLASPGLLIAEVYIRLHGIHDKGERSKIRCDFAEMSIIYLSLAISITVILVLCAL